MTQTIELILNPEVISVEGVVNGERYSFALTGSTDNMHIWTADVPKSEDGIYRVTIEVICGVQRCADRYSTVLYYGLHLVTDRTQLDVDRVNALAAKGWEKMTSAERDEWSAGLKGAYNATDLNRVQSAARYIKDRFETHGYSVNLSEQRTWTQQDTPSMADLRMYLEDIAAIRNVFAMLQTTPAVPDSMARLTYTKANDIEQILHDVDMLLSNMIASFVYSGDFFGGET